MVRSQLHSVMTCDWSGHDRIHWVKGKRLRKENITMWFIGHMGGLQCGTGLMVQWV